MYVEWNLMEIRWKSGGLSRWIRGRDQALGSGWMWLVGVKGGGFFLVTLDRGEVVR